MRYSLFALHDRRGISLMEVMIAIALLSMATLGSATVLSVARYNAERDTQLTRQSMAANACLSHIRVGDWKGVVAPGEHALTAEELRALHLPDDGMTQAVLTVREVEPRPLREVTISIQRSTHRGPMSTSVSTWIGGKAQ